MRYKNDRDTIEYTPEKYKELKETYYRKCIDLIEKLGYLNIIYLRVSTDKLGQDEKDQIRDILKTFNLQISNCVLILAKESGYKLSKQSKRKFNIVLDLIQECDEDIEKNCYFWSIDRIYRNRELTETFYALAKKTNTRIYSYREQFINQIADLPDKLPEGMGFILDMQVNFLVSMFAWMAEMESKTRGERLLKSLRMKENGRMFTNKGRAVGRKRKDANNRPIKDSKKIIALDTAVLRLIEKGVSYRKIIEIFETKKNIKLNLYYVSHVKKRAEKYREQLIKEGKLEPFESE